MFDYIGWNNLMSIKYAETKFRSPDTITDIYPMTKVLNGTIPRVNYGKFLSLATNVFDQFGGYTMPNSVVVNLSYINAVVTSELINLVPPTPPSFVWAGHFDTNHCDQIAQTVSYSVMSKFPDGTNAVENNQFNLVP
jgi:hypothetical protein